MNRGIDEWVTAEYGDREHSADGVFSGYQGISPVGKYIADAVHRKVLIVAEFLEAEYIYFLLFHVAGNLFAGVASNLSSKIADIISGYFQISIGIVTTVMSFRDFFCEIELKNGKYITVVESQCRKRDEDPATAG